MAIAYLGKRVIKYLTCCGCNGPLSSIVWKYAIALYPEQARGYLFEGVLFIA
jgi:hypothetical protein